MKDIKHILIVAAVFVAVIVAFLFVRRIFVPDSFGKFGHYRAAAVDDKKALPIRFAGKEACAACHQEEARRKSRGAHRTVGCESCHGALQAHVEDPVGVKPWKPGEDEARGFCGRCHAENISAPPRFPQVNLIVHNPGIECIMCHNAHRPRP